MNELIRNNHHKTKFELESDLEKRLSEKSFQFLDIYRESSILDSKNAYRTEERQYTKRDGFFSNRNSLTSDDYFEVKIDIKFTPLKKESKKISTFMTYVLYPKKPLKISNYTNSIPKFEKYGFDEKYKSEIVRDLGSYLYDHRGPFIKFGRKFVAGYYEPATPQTNRNKPLTSKDLEQDFMAEYYDYEKAGYIDKVPSMIIPVLYEKMFKDWNSKLVARLTKPVLVIERGNGIYLGELCGVGERSFSLCDSFNLIAFDFSGESCGFDPTGKEPFRMMDKTEHNYNKTTAIFEMTKIYQ